MSTLYRFIIKYLNNYKTKLREKEFKLNSIVGDNTNITYNSSIKNESKDKSRIIIGDSCNIMGNIVCKSSGNVVIGNFTTIQDNSSIMCLEKIIIGNFVGIAEGTLIIDNNTHPTYIEDWVAHRIRVAPGGGGYPGLGNGWELSVSSPVSIQDGVWIGGYCTILKGVTIGEGAIIARSSVVTKDVDPYTLVAGNPARKVKDLKRSNENVICISKRLLSIK